MRAVDNAIYRATVISAVGVNVGAYVAQVLALLYILYIHKSS